MTTPSDSLSEQQLPILPVSDGHLRLASRISRRTFLCGATACWLSTRAWAAPDDSAGPGTVRSEVGRLKRVLVHPPGPEVAKAFPMLIGAHSMLTWELLREAAGEQHRLMVKALHDQGAEVLFFRDMLEQALAEARRQGSLKGWLSTNVSQLADSAADVTADTLLGRDDRWVYRKDSEGHFRPLVAPMTTLFFTRDCAAMTPRGLVICNFNNRLRAFESILARFIFRHAPPLQRYQIAFDAIAKKVFLQGGDLLVVDDRTLLVGIGNSTSESAAIRLAQDLNMDVLAVQLPSPEWQPGGWDGLREIFYHADSLLNFVDRRTVLAVPYLLETKYLTDSPLVDALEGFGRMDRLGDKELAARLAAVRNVGWVKRYLAGSGKRDFTLPRTKIVDYLRDAGYRIVFVGGRSATSDSPLKHVMEHVLHECRFMAVNVVATAPGKVLAYDGNPRTAAALQRANVNVTTFPASELVRANGGPHCLTMPLERAR